MSKLRKSARDQDCLVRIPGVCNHNPETTILAHLNGGGMGMKHPDLFGAFCCSDCHDVIDLRRNVSITVGDIRRCHYEGIFRTQLFWLENNFIGEIK